MLVNRLVCSCYPRVLFNTVIEVKLQKIMCFSGIRLVIFQTSP